MTHETTPSSSTPAKPSPTPRDNAPRPAGAPGGGETEIYTLVLRELRGRLRLAAVLACVGLLFGAAVGWKQGRTVYRSEGLVRIAYSKPEILKPTDQTAPMAMYEPFLRSQVLLLGSHRVVEAALQEPAWKATGRGSSPQMIADFARSLRVEHPPETQNLRVTFDSDSPKVAAAAVQSVLAAYAKVYSGHETDLQLQRVNELTKREATLREEIAQVQAKLQTLTVDDIDQRYAAAEGQERALATRLAELRLAHALAGEGQMGDDTQLSVADMALLDPTMRGLVAAQDTARERAGVLAQMGMGPRHPSMILAQAELNQATQRVETYAAEFRQARLARMRTSHTEEMLTRPELAEQLQIVGGLHENALDLLRRLTSQREQVTRLKAQATRMRDELDTVRTRREALALEAAMSGRLELVSNGEIPLQPVTNTRMKFAGAGAMLGILLPLSGLVLVGLIRREYRFVDEISQDLTRHGGPTLLGALPAMEPTDTIDHAREMAQGLHQIRVLLQLNPKDRMVLLITSASPNEGKTSLTAGLGYSFKAAGRRVLLIDCDLISQSLTRGFGAVGKRGLLDAAKAGSMRKCLQRVAPGLSLLPVGNANAFDACTISPDMLRPILQQARRHFDVVLVDSGPMLGSVEASVLAPLVDGVVLAAARGQQPKLVLRTIGHLSALGARMRGFVFNKANPQDVAESYGYSRSGSELPETTPPTTRSRRSQFGPLVESILRYMPEAVLTPRKVGFHRSVSTGVTNV